MAKKPIGSGNKQFYGIAEWYGRRFVSLTDAERKHFASVSNTQVTCPFFAQVPNLGPKSGKLNCNKKGGVCSLRNFIPPVSVGADINFGPITATCPNRFLQDGTVVKHIGTALLGNDDPLFAKEIPFLMRPKTGLAGELEEAAKAEEETHEKIEAATGEEVAAAESGREDVGRIDMVFVHPSDGDKWCAVEFQAVYFSGSTMSVDMAVIANFTGNGVPMPGGARAPDFRSSGPKRLMPQLMIKVPTLRRWGKKMVVVIDRPFLESMAVMERQDHISNSDIVWVVARFDEHEGQPNAVLAIDDTIFTTLDESVKALTSGRPTNLPTFQARLAGKLSAALGGSKSATSD